MKRKVLVRSSVDDLPTDNVHEGNLALIGATLYVYQDGEWGKLTPTPTNGAIPTGTINGTNGTDGNATFTLPNTPDPTTSLIVVKTRAVMQLNVDYTLSGTTLTFLSPQIPITGEVIHCWFTY